MGSSPTACGGLFSVKALHWRSTALLPLGRAGEALPLLQRLIPLAEAVDNLWVLAHALNHAHSIYQRRGELERSGQHIERAVEAAERLGDPNLIAFVQLCLGEYAFDSGEWVQAHACYELAATLAHGSWLAK